MNKYIEELKQSFIINAKEYSFLTSGKFKIENQDQADYISYWADQCVEAELNYLEGICNHPDYYTWLDYLQQAAHEAPDMDFPVHVEALESLGLRNKTLEEARNHLSIRAYSVLFRNKIKTIKEIVNMSLKEISSLRNVGANTIAELEETLMIKFV